MVQTVSIVTVHSISWNGQLIWSFDWFVVNTQLRRAQLSSWQLHNRRNVGLHFSMGSSVFPGHRTMSFKVLHPLDAIHYWWNADYPKRVFILNINWTRDCCNTALSPLTIRLLCLSSHPYIYGANLNQLVCIIEHSIQCGSTWLSPTCVDFLFHTHKTRL